MTASAVVLLMAAFPENQREVADITESYVAVYYGELPERPEDLSKVRSAWQQIQQRDAGAAHMLNR